MAGKVARGDIRLFRFPEPDKQRPVLVLTSDSIIDRLSRITVAPLTSTIRGVASEVVLGPDDGMKDACAINLHNIFYCPESWAGTARGQPRCAPPRSGVRCNRLRPRLRSIGSVVRSRLGV